MVGGTLPSDKRLSLAHALNTGAHWGSDGHEAAGFSSLACLRPVQVKKLTEPSKVEFRTSLGCLLCGLVIQTEQRRQMSLGGGSRTTG